MHAFKRRHYKWLRHFPRRKHLKGGWLHRVLGEKLFAAELWKPSRQTVAGSVAAATAYGLVTLLSEEAVHLRDARRRPPSPLGEKPTAAECDGA